MKSSELAKLAGVSVRTLRHYHAIGLLPEPPRRENGYRDYGADELVRVLRIKRLAALGFSLSSIGEVLDETDRNLASASESNADAALDELDRELALQIERLEEQRRTIALLKREQLDPELPVRFARVVKPLMDGQRAASAVTRADHATMLLAGHLYSEEDLAELERVVTAIEELGLMEQIHHLQKRTDELAADASLDEQDALVEDIETAMVPLLECFDFENWSDEYEPAELLMLETMNKGLNEAQARVSERVERALEARILARRDAFTSSPQEA